MADMFNNNESFTLQDVAATQPTDVSYENFFTSNEEVTRSQRLEQAKQEKLDRLSKVKQKASFDDSYTDLGNGVLESNRNKVWNTSTGHEVQSMLDYLVSDRALTRDAEGNAIDKDGNIYTGKTRRMYMFGTNGPGDAIKFGLSRGDLDSAEARYIPDGLPGGYGWDPGEYGVNTNNKLMDVLLPYEDATLFEGIAHGREAALANRAVKDKYGEFDLADKYGDGVTEYYTSREGLFGTPTQTDIGLGKQLFSQFSNQIYGDRYSTPESKEADFQQFLQQNREYAADNAGILDRLGNTASAFASGFVNSLFVSPVQAVGDLTGAYDISGTAEKVQGFFGYNPVMEERAMQEIGDQWAIVADENASTADRVRAAGNGILKALLTPEMLGSSMGMLASWTTPGALLKAIGVGSKFARVAGVIDKAVEQGKIGKVAATALKAKKLMSVRGAKAALANQSGYLVSALGEVNNQYNEWVQNNNGVELEGAEKGAWFAKRFAIQVINQNIDKLVDFDLVMKHPGLIASAIPAVKQMTNKEFANVAKTMAKGVGATTINMGSEAGQEYTQTMMELFNSRYGSEKFSDVENFQAFLSDPRNTTEAGIAALAGAGGAPQFEAVGTILPAIGGVAYGVNKGVNAIQGKGATTEHAPETPESDAEVAEVVKANTQRATTGTNTAASYFGAFGADNAKIRETAQQRAQQHKKELLEGTHTVFSSDATPEAKLGELKALAVVVGAEDGETDSVKELTTAIVEQVKPSTPEEEATLVEEIQKAYTVGQQFASIKSMAEVAEEVSTGTRGFLTYVAQAYAAEAEGDQATYLKSLNELDRFYNHQRVKLNRLEDGVQEAKDNAIAAAELLVQKGQAKNLAGAIAQLRKEAAKKAQEKINKNKPLDGLTVYFNDEKTGSIVIPDVEIYRGLEHPGDEKRPSYEKERAERKKGIFGTIQQITEEVAAMGKVHATLIQNIDSQQETEVATEATVQSEELTPALKTLSEYTPENIETSQVTFEEDQSNGYASRTRKNASADATIAIAVNFNSAGEKLTKRSVGEQGKKYIPIDANSLKVTKERVSQIVKELNDAGAKSLNIAGNGIYTMKGKYSQEQIDNFTLELLTAVLNSPDLKNKIESIRTGGQTGFDEAGAKAGLALGISTKILAPKGWKFRNVNGQDISDKNQFMARFENLKQEQVSPKTTTTLEEDIPSVLDDFDESALDYSDKDIPPMEDFDEPQYDTNEEDISPIDNFDESQYDIEGESIYDFDEAQYDLDERSIDDLDEPMDDLDESMALYEEYSKEGTKEVTPKDPEVARFEAAFKEEKAKFDNHVGKRVLAKIKALGNFPGVNLFTNYKGGGRQLIPLGTLVSKFVPTGFTVSLRNEKDILPSTAKFAENLENILSNYNSDIKQNPFQLFFRDADGNIDYNMVEAAQAAVYEYIIEEVSDLSTIDRTEEEIAEILGINEADVSGPLADFLREGGITLKLAAAAVGEKLLKNIGANISTPQNREAMASSLGMVALQGTDLLITDNYQPTKADTKIKGKNITFIKGATGIYSSLKEIRDDLTNFEQRLGVEFSKTKTYRKEKNKKPHKVGILRLAHQNATKDHTETVNRLENTAFGFNSGHEILLEMFKKDDELDVDALVTHLLGPADPKAHQDARDRYTARKDALMAEIGSYKEAFIDVGSDGDMFFNWFIAKNHRIHLDSNTLNPQNDKRLARWLVTTKNSKKEISKKDIKSALAGKKTSKEALMFLYSIVQAFDGVDGIPGIDKDTPTTVLKAAKELLNMPEEELLAKAKDPKIAHLGHAALAIANIRKYDQPIKKEDTFISDMVLEVDGLTNGFAFRAMQFPVKSTVPTQFTPEVWLEKVGVLLETSDKKGLYHQLNSMSGARAAGQEDVYISVGGVFQEAVITQKNSIKDPNQKAWVALLEKFPKKGLPDFTNTSDDAVKKFVRNLMKSPVMIFNYAAGGSKIANGLVQDQIHGMNYLSGRGLVDLIMAQDPNNKGEYLIKDEELDAAFGKKKGATYKQARKDLKTNSFKKMSQHTTAMAMLYDDMSEVISHLYVGPLKTTLETLFSSQTAINLSLTAASEFMYEYFKETYNTWRNSPEGINADEEAKTEFLKKIASIIPGIVGASSDDQLNKITFLKRILEDTSNEVLIRFNKDVTKNRGKNNELTANTVSRAYGDPGVGAAVLTILGLDGAVMAKTINQTYANIEGGLLPVHDALVLGVGEANAVNNYNSNFYTTNRRYSIIQEMTNAIQKLGENPEVRSYTLKVGPPGKEKLTSFSDMQTVLEQTNLWVQESRQNIFNRNVKVGQMVGIEGTMAEINVKTATKEAKDFIKEKANSISEEIKNPAIKKALGPQYASFVHKVENLIKGCK